MPKRRLFARRNSQRIRVFVQKNKANIIGLLVLSVIFAGIVLTLNYYSLTGLYFLEQREALKGPLNVSSDAVIDLELMGSPGSLSLSGYLLGDGAVRVYLANTGSLILDSSSLANLQFDNVCGEACELKDVPAKARLLVELNGSATLILESAKYATINHPPLWTGKTGFVVANGSKLSINLGLFVEDLDGDELVYSATSNEDIEAIISGSLLTLIPKNSFEGRSFVTIVVSDMKETLRQDIAVETAIISAREQELLNLPMHLDVEVLDAMELVGSSDVIIQLKDKYPFGSFTLNQLAKLEVDEFKRSLNLETAEFGISQNADGEILREFDSLNSLALKMTDSGFEKIKQNPLVAGIFADKKFEVNLQDSIPLIKADSAELQNLNSEEPVSVCVLDTGIDYNHEWFKGAILGGYNAFDNSTNAADDNNHGTHVSGIVRAVSNAGIVPVKVCDASGICKASDILAGIDYCINKRLNYSIQVISGSFGDGLKHSADCVGVFDSALAYADRIGIISVFASGNEGYKDGINYPACSQLTISAGSISKNGTISPFTNLPVDILAPGENINSSIINGYAEMSGTSMASAHVAGTAAILKAYSPALAQEGVKALLGSSTSSVNSYPLLDSYASYSLLAGGSADSTEFKIAAVTNITACGTTVSTPGDYEVTAYLSTSGTSDCITISKGNVSIDCLGNKIVSGGTGQAFDMGNNNLDNITIRNCFISGFNQGVYGTGAISNLTVSNTTFNGTKVDGIEANKMGGSSISYNTFQYLSSTTGHLIEFNGDNNKIINNTAREFKTRGLNFGLTTSEYNNISDNYFDMKNSSGFVVLLRTATDNYFSNNTMVNISGSAYGFDLDTVETGGDNFFIGTNLINGTDVTERWVYNRDNYTMQGKNYHEQNFFDVAGVIIHTVKNLTINQSNFTKHEIANVHLYNVQNATIQNCLFNDTAKDNLILQAIGNITIRDSIISSAGTAGIVLKEPSYDTHVADRVNIFTSNFSSNTDFDFCPRSTTSFTDLEYTLVGNRFTGSSGTRVRIGGRGLGVTYRVNYLNITDNIFSSTAGMMLDVQGISTGGGGYIKYNNFTGTADGIRLYASSDYGRGAVNTIVEYNNITGRGAATYSGIVISGHDNTILNNNISYFQYGIECTDNPSGNNITANNITHSLDYGIYLETDGTTVTSHKNYISKNVIRHLNDQYYYYNLPNVTLENLNINENKTMYPSPIMVVDTKNVVIRHNNITTNNSAAGIWLTNVSDANVWNNTIKNASWGIGLYGIATTTAASMHNVTVIRNAMLGLVNHGVYEIGNGFSYDITIYNNTITWGNNTNNVYGIYLADAANKFGSYNISANNITKGWDYGIYDSGVDYNIIQDNYLDDIKTVGIYIEGQNNTLYNNTLRRISGVPASNAIEISGSGAEYNQILYNYIENASTGIRWSSSAENNSAANNTIYNASRTGLYFSSTAKQQRVYENIICHNKLGFNFTGAGINHSGLDIRKNYFCIQNIFPVNGTIINVSQPLISFNATNLLNRSTTNCTAYISTVPSGDNTSLAIEHANQTINTNRSLSKGGYFLNITCLDNFANRAFDNMINFTSIFNVLPTIPVINITSTDALNRTNGTLIGEHTYDDVDGDAWIYNETKWYNNAIEVPELRNKTVVGEGNTSEGQNWTYSARVYDGTDWSNWYNSSDLTITTLNCGDTITADTTLTRNLTGSGTCLTIGANNIYLNCSGYTLNGTNSGYGIDINSKSGIWIRDCILLNFSSGIYTLNSTYTNLTNNTAGDNLNYGLDIKDSKFIRLEENKAYGSIAGFYFRNSNDSWLNNNIAYNNTQKGFHLLSLSTNNTLAGNSANNASYGFDISSGSHRLYNNSAKNNTIAGFYINSAGNILMRNNASNNTGDGFNLGTSGDSSNISYSLIDFNTGNGVYVVGNNNRFEFNTLINNTNDAFEIRGTSNYLDNNTIYGTNLNNGLFFWSGGQNGIAVNNYIKDYSTGTYIYVTGNITLKNNTFLNSGAYGILTNGAGNNSIIGNIVNITNDCIVIQDSNGNISNNTINTCNADYGISLLSVNNTFLGYNIITNANTAGIYNEKSNYTILKSNIINSAGGLRITTSHNISVIDYTISNYSFTSVQNPLFENTSAGKIKFLNTISSVSGTNLLGDLNIQNNRIFANSSAKTGFNLSANLSFYNIQNETPMPIYDIEDDGSFVYCPTTICTNLSFIGNIFVYNVTHFTTFSSSENIPPAIPIINITSTDPLNRSNGTLIGWHNYNDSDNDAWIYNETKWYNNTIEVPELINKTRVGEGNTTKGQNWTYSAKVFDGSDWSVWYNSSSITIANTVPEVTTPAISPTMPYDSEDLKTNITYMDIDADSGTVYFKWWKDNTTLIITQSVSPVANGSIAATTLDKSYFSANDVIIVEAWANDGAADSIHKNSSAVVILASAAPPTAVVPGAGGGGIVAPTYYPPYPGAIAPLLDVILLHADSPVESGDFLDFSYFIKAMSKISGDINIGYWLEPIDSMERVIEGKSVVFFKDYEGKILDSKMYLPKSLRGLYNLYLQAAFGNYSAEAQTVIEVVEEAPAKVSIAYLDEAFKKTESEVGFVFVVSSNKDYQVPVTVKELLSKGDSIVWQNQRDIMLTKSEKFQDAVKGLEPGDYELKIALMRDGREGSFIVRNFNMPEKPRIEQPRPAKISGLWIFIPAGLLGLLLLLLVLVVASLKKRENLLYKRVSANLAKIEFMKTMPYLMVDLASVKNGKETVSYLIRFYLRFKKAIGSKDKALVDSYKANEERLRGHITFLNKKVMRLPYSPYTTQRDEYKLLKVYVRNMHKQTKNRYFKDVALDLNPKKKVQLNQAGLIIPKKSFY